MEIIENSCCGNSSSVNKPDDYSCGCLGYAFVPEQELNCTYDDTTALNRGSLFPESDLTIEEYGSICKGMGGVEDE